MRSCSVRAEADGRGKADVAGGLCWGRAAGCAPESGAAALGAEALTVALADDVAESSLAIAVRAMLTR